MTRRQSIDAALRRLAPHVPERDLADIVDHAIHSRGLKIAAAETAAWLSLVSSVRHNYTEYEDLLGEGYGVEAARHFCREQINEVLAAWGCRRRLTDAG